MPRKSKSDKGIKERTDQRKVLFSEEKMTILQEAIPG